MKLYALHVQIPVTSQHKEDETVLLKHVTGWFDPLRFYENIDDGLNMLTTESRESL